MDMGLRDRTVVVTGGASNIGYAITTRFAEEGAVVFIADRDEKQAVKASQEIPGDVRVMAMDVSDPDQVAAAMGQVVEATGRIDVLVNSAGGAVDGPFVNKPRDEIAIELADNVWGFIHCTQAVLPCMIERGFGRIVSISSDAAKRGTAGHVVYSGAKASLIAMSKALAREVGEHGITCNAVCPGFIPPKAGTFGERSLWSGPLAARRQLSFYDEATKALAVPRPGTPDEVADAVVFLGSLRASYITGQALSVSGGYSMM